MSSPPGWRVMAAPARAQAISVLRRAAMDVAASQTLSAGETITLTGGGSLASGGKITGGSLSIQLGGGQPGAGRNALTTSTDSLLLARSGPLTISAGDWTHAGTAGAVGDATITLSGALASSGGSLILRRAGHSASAPLPWTTRASWRRTAV
ncbi:hypothetical protein V6L77_00950 [Pannonibacter sp. Pt2-lr]